MVPLDQRLGAHRLLGGDVVLDDGPEHGQLPILDGTSSFPAVWHSTDPSANPTGRESSPMDGDATRFTEVADRVWVARHSWLDATSPWSRARAGCWSWTPCGRPSGPRPPRLAEVLPLDGPRRHGGGEHPRALRPRLGNGACTGVAVFAHEAAAETIPRHVGEVRTGRASDPHAADMLATEVVTAARPVLVRGAGPRRPGRELLHPGRGHTAGDLVVRVPDADVLVAGDLVEESAPPAYGPDSFPLDWPASLDLVISLLGPARRRAGARRPVDRPFVGGPACGRRGGRRDPRGRLPSRPDRRGGAAEQPGRSRPTARGRRTAGLRPGAADARRLPLV